MFPQKSFIKSTSRREFLDLGSDGSDLFNKIMKISKNNKQVSQRKNNMVVTTGKQEAESKIWS